MPLLAAMCAAWRFQTGVRRFRPAGRSDTPRLISAKVIAEMNRSSSACADIQAASEGDGTGLTASLMMFVSSR